MTTNSNQNTTLEIDTQTKVKRHVIRIVIVVLCIIILFFILQNNRRKLPAPSETERVLAVSRLYKAASDYYCYFNDDDINWNMAYEKAIADVLEAKTFRNYLIALECFRANLKDGHADGLIFTSGAQKLKDIGVLPFYCSWYDNEYVVIKTVLSNIHIGDVLVQVDGVETNKWLEDNLGETVATQTPDTREKKLCEKFFMFFQRGKSFTCTFKSTVGDYYSTKVKASYYPEMTSLPIKPVLSSGMDEHVIYSGNAFQITELPGNVLVLKNSSLQGEKVWFEFIDYVYPMINHSNRIILDLRNNNGGNSRIGYEVLTTLTGKTLSHDNLQVQYSIKSCKETTYSALLRGPLQNLYHEAFSAVYSDEEIARITDLGEKMERNACFVDEEQYNEILTLLGGQPTPVIDEGFGGVTLSALNLPVVVLIDSESGSAIDTVAQYAEDMGLLTVGTHTAGATGDLFLVDLGGGVLSGFSSFHITNNINKKVLHNNGVMAKIQIDNNATSICKGVDLQLIAAWNVFQEN